MRYNGVFHHKTGGLPGIQEPGVSLQNLSHRRMCTENAKCEKTVLRHVWQDYVEMAEHVRYKPIVLRSNQAFRFVNESCIQKADP